MQNQSRFKPGESCINRFLPITHKIYESFDDGRGSKLEGKGKFSLTYQKCWTKFDISLSQIGILGNLLTIIEYFLAIIDLNGKASRWTFLHF